MERLAREQRPPRPGLMRRESEVLAAQGLAGLEELPGIGRALAEHIVRVREEVGGFTSLEELGVVADLDGALVERIRDDVVFLPR